MSRDVCRTFAVHTGTILSERTLRYRYAPPFTRRNKTERASYISHEQRPVYEVYKEVLSHLSIEALCVMQARAPHSVRMDAAWHVAKFIS
jgi:hypothetical protein